MKYEYESIIGGIFNFTIPGEGRTVQLFQGSKVIVEKKLAGTYLRLLKLVREIPEEVIKTTKQKAKVADKITAVTEIEEVEVKAEEVKAEEVKAEEVEVKAEDTITEVVESEKSTPRKRTRRKKTDS